METEQIIGTIAMLISGMFILIAGTIIYKRCGYIKPGKDHPK